MLTLNLRDLDLRWAGCEILNDQTLCNCLYAEWKVSQAPKPFQSSALNVYN